MAKPGLLNINTTNTFQKWLDTTNEIVDIMNSEVITASVTGDTTGSSSNPLDATLFGSFTSTELIATDYVSTNLITPTSGSSEIEFDAPIDIQTSSVVVARFDSTNGARTRYTGPNIDWDVGILNNSTNSFTVDVSGGSGTSLTLTTSGDLEVSGNFVGDLLGDVEGDVTGNLVGDVTGTVSDISNHDTDDLSEGATNLYFTNSRARSSISSTGAVNYNSSTGVISLSDSQIRQLFSAGQGIIYDSSTGEIAANDPIWGGTRSRPSAESTYSDVPVGTKVAFWNERTYTSPANSNGGQVTISDRYMEIIQRTSTGWARVGG